MSAAQAIPDEIFSKSFSSKKFCGKKAGSFSRSKSLKHFLWPVSSLLNSYNSECQNLPFPLQSKPVKVNKVNWRIFIFCTLGTNGLRLKIKIG